MRKYNSTAKISFFSQTKKHCCWRNQASSMSLESFCELVWVAACWPSAAAPAVSQRPRDCDSYAESRRRFEQAASCWHSWGWTTQVSAGCRRTSADEWREGFEIWGDGKGPLCWRWTHWLSIISFWKNNLEWYAIATYLFELQCDFNNLNTGFEVQGSVGS